MRLTSIMVQAYSAVAARAMRTARLSHDRDGRKIGEQARTATHGRCSFIWRSANV